MEKERKKKGNLANFQISSMYRNMNPILIIWSDLPILDNSKDNRVNIILIWKKSVLRATWAEPKLILKQWHTVELTRGLFQVELTRGLIWVELTCGLVQIELNRWLVQVELKKVFKSGHLLKEILFGTAWILCVDLFYLECSVFWWKISKRVQICYITPSTIGH